MQALLARVWERASWIRASVSTSSPFWTFLAALVAGLGGFAFGIVAAAVWLYILTPLQTATLIMGLGLVVQGYSVWKLRHALHWRRLTPILVGTALGVPLGVFTLSHAEPGYLRLGIGTVLALFSLYGLWRPTIKPIKAGAVVGDLGAGFLNGVLGGATGLAGIVAVIWYQLRAAGPRISSAPCFSQLFVVALPVVLGGTWLGLKFYGRLDEAQFRKVVLILLLASGAALLFR
jgi:uncharacterized membrane protein YfcA